MYRETLGLLGTMRPREASLDLDALGLFLVSTPVDGYGRARCEKPNSY